MEPARKIVYEAYRRKSEEDNGRQILSLQSQEEAIYEAFPHLEIDMLEPESKSAHRPYQRPIFNQLIQRLKRNKGRYGVLAWHPNRLSRNAVEAGIIVDLVETGVIADLKFVSYTFENTPEGIMMLQFALSQGQYESSKLKREVRRGMRTKVKMGQFPGKVPPGYRNSGPTSTKGERRVLVDKKRFPIVRKIFERALTGRYNIAELYHLAVYEWGLTPYRSRTPLSRAAFYKLLRNVFYTGYFKWEGELHKGAHPPIITMDEYEKLQQVVGRNVRRLPDRRYIKRENGKLSGLVTCGECGYQLTASEKHRYYRGTGRTAVYVYYTCARSSKTMRCGQRPISVSRLNKKVDAELAKYDLIPEFLQVAVTCLERGLDSDQHDSVESKQQTLAALRTRLGRLIDLRTTGEIDVEDFRERQNSYKGTIARLEGAIRKVQRRQQVRFEKTVAELTFAEAVGMKYRAGDGDTQREIVLRLAESLVLTDGQLSLLPRKQFKPLAVGYSPLLVRFQLIRTSSFASAKRKTALIAAVFLLWCTVVRAIADVLTEDVKPNEESL